MKKRPTNIKRTIKKKIESNQKNYAFIEKRSAVNEKNKMRPGGVAPLPVKLLSRAEIRANLRKGIKVEKPEPFIDYGEFKKRVDIEFDIVFCVSSYNRLKKMERILNQLFTQKTKYRFKFILMNDGSTEKRYAGLKHKYPEIIYMKNRDSGGKVNYWKTINAMWHEAEKFSTYGIVQLDDDFILCDNFLDTLLDKFFEIKEESNDYMIFHFHLYNFDKDKPLEPFWFDENEIFVDGGMLLDVQFLEKMDYELDEIADRVTPKTSSFVWVRLKERLLEFRMKIYRHRNSLVWHDGNDDSKLHPNIRSKKRVYTKNYIDEEKISYEQ